MNLPVLQRAERHACAEQLGEDVAYHNPRLEFPIIQKPMVTTG
ncbi:MAG TPA: hypothetical protein VK813_15840 [Edaphobacter sp.]|nr:hypothetical protein [Edaphobacter sp.]